MSGINNAGQVAGLGTFGGVNLAFIGSPSGSVVVPLPTGWTLSMSTGINASGQIAAYGNNGGVSQAFIGTTGGSTAIPLPAGSTGVGSNALNDLGQVVGTSGGVISQAFLGTVSGSTPIPLPSGSTDSLGYGVNASGQVTGFGVHGAVSQAYIGNTLGSTLIPFLPGWTSSRGEGINDAGQVAGFGFNGTGMQAFIATTSGSTAIPFPPGGADVSVTLQSVNNLGTVVGSSTVGGWIWDATNGTRLLNSLVPSGWSVTAAASISSNGLILAIASLNGGANQFVELSPALPSTPAPSTLALFLIGAAFCWISSVGLSRLPRLVMLNGVRHGVIGLVRFGNVHLTTNWKFCDIFQSMIGRGVVKSPPPS
jgi:hypothetical protein